MKNGLLNENMTSLFLQKSAMKKLKEMKLNGKVKSVRETAEILTGRTCQPASGSVTYFNETGELIKLKSYQSSLARCANTEHSFGKNERLMKTVTTIDRIVTAIDIYHYHKNGAISQRESKSADVGLRAPKGTIDLNKFQITKYDLKGNPIEKMNSMDGITISKSIYTYDKNGKLLEKIEYDENDSISSSESYKYDDKGNISEKISSCCDVFENNQTKVLNTYDAQGRNLESRTFYREGEPEEILKKNWLLQSTTEYSYDAESQFINTTDIYYDENDQIEDETTSQKVISLQTKQTGKMEATQEEIQYEYEYDDSQNWTKKIPLLKNYPIRVERREITYYD